MTEYISGLDKCTYIFSRDGKVFSPKNDNSRKSVAAFLDIVAQSNTLNCIVDEVSRGSVHTVKMTHIDTFAEATLSINYGGLYGYHAKITLSNGQQVSVQGGHETAMRKIANYLKNPQKAKKKICKVPVVREAVAVTDQHDKYADLEAEFEE
ncbi:MAG: hypothetical protein QW165_05285 [Candidatus Woesearchaeota archaeon]